jgi:transposase
VRVGVRDDATLEVRTYPTFTSGLETLADWLQAEGVTQVVMEATGQYGKPIW